MPSVKLRGDSTRDAHPRRDHNNTRVEIPAQAAAMGGEIIPDHLAKKLEPDFERRLAASRDLALRPVMRAAVARHEIIEIGC